MVALHSIGIVLSESGNEIHASRAEFRSARSTTWSQGYIDYRNIHADMRT